jgi:hypothetical protein
MLCATTALPVDGTPAKSPRWVSGHGVADGNGGVVGNHVLYRPHEVGEGVAVGGDDGEVAVQALLLLSGEVNDDVRAEELLGQRRITGG